MDGRINDGQAKKRAADARTETLASTIAKIQKGGWIASHGLGIGKTPEVFKHQR